MIGNEAVMISAYNMASRINQEIIYNMAREFEQDLISSGNVTPSIIKQKKAMKREFSLQKDSSKRHAVSEGAIICGSETDMPPYVIRLMDILHLSDVREVRYDGNKVSILSGLEQKDYIIETKGGKLVDVRFKKKVFVNK